MLNLKILIKIAGMPAAKREGGAAIAAPTVGAVTEVEHSRATHRSAMALRIRKVLMLGTLTIAWTFLNNVVNSNVTTTSMMISEHGQQV